MTYNNLTLLIFDFFGDFMNRFFRRALQALQDEIRFIDILEKLVLKGEIQVCLYRNYIRRPGKQKEPYIQIQILETPNRLIQFIIGKKVSIVDSIYVYENLQQHKHIYTHMHHILSIGPKEELNDEIAIKVFKNWIKEIFNVDIDVTIVDSK